MLIGNHDLSYMCVSPTSPVSTIAIVNIICSCTHREELPCSSKSILSKLCGAHSLQKISSYKHDVLDTPPPKSDFPALQELLICKPGLFIHEDRSMECNCTP